MTETATLQFNDYNRLAQTQEAEDKRLEFVARKMCLLMEGGIIDIDMEAILDRIPQVSALGNIIITRKCKLWELHLLPAKLALQLAEEWDSKTRED